MTTKLEQAARQLLEVAEGIQHGTDWNNGTHAKIYRPKFPEAIAALREALAEQAEQEPVIGAYEVVNEKGDEWSLVYPAAVHRYKSIPEERITQTFYATPVRTKDLTDDELLKIWQAQVPASNRVYEFARAVIAADREANK